MSEQLEKNNSVMYLKSEFKPTVYSTLIDEVDLGILLELGSIGAGHAATALSQVLQQQVTINIPRIHTIPPHELPKHYEKHEEPTTAVYMQIANNDCDILLAFDAVEAKKIAAIMTMAPSVEELDPAMEESAIQELGNILIGSFLTAISDFTGIQLIPTTPQRVIDTFDSIIDNFVVKQAITSDNALIFDTQFKRSNEDAKSILILFPSPQLQKQLVQKSKEQMIN
ncbi:MAG: chemotaxis protein CheC [Candidatus Bathyarchaeota archaeon]|nr:chemotaxis protein CheC [Candidatus Bathyarchaeota archaeon]